MISFKVHHVGNFFGGDPYCGARSEEIKQKNVKIQQLEQEVKRLTDKVDRLELRHGLRGATLGQEGEDLAPYPLKRKGNGK